MAESGLVLIAHGSRDPQWHAPFARVRDALRARWGAERVELAFLEFAEPPLETAIQDLADQGIRVVRILPLFMSGGHVQRDVAAQVEAIRAERGDLELELRAPVGTHPTLLAALIEIGEEALR